MSDKATLVNIFQQNAVPTGTNFADFIDSCANLLETAEQDFNGPIYATKIITPKLSAASINGTSIGGLVVNSIQVNTSFIATTDLSANSYNVYCSGTRYPVAIISAVGTTQAQAQTALLTTSIVRGQGTTDGQATGFGIAANKTGWVQYFKYEGAVSANLWPPTGGTINNLATNTPFPLVAGTSYTIFHVAASAYGVK